MNPPKARMIFALCTHQGRETLTSLVELLSLNLFIRNPSQQGETSKKTDPHCWCKQVQVHRLPALNYQLTKFQAKNVLRNHIVNLEIKKTQTKCVIFLFRIKSIHISSVQTALLIRDGLLLDYFETTHCALCLQKPQQWCLELHLKDTPPPKK